MSQQPPPPYSAGHNYPPGPKPSAPNYERGYQVFTVEPVRVQPTQILVVGGCPSCRVSVIQQLIIYDGIDRALEFSKKEKIVEFE